MEVWGLSEWMWDHFSRSILGLPDVTEVDSPGDLLDEDWSQLLLPQLLVDAKVVDLRHLDCLVVHSSLNWGSRDESQELSVGGPHADMPILLVVWSAKGPLEELDGVFESEDAITVFHVMVSEERKKCLQIVLRGQIKSVPLKPSWELIRIFSHIFHLALLNGTVLFDIFISDQVEDGLIVPELMRSKKLDLINEAPPFKWIHSLVIFQLISAVLHHLEPLHLVDLLLGGLLILYRSPS